MIAGPSPHAVEIGREVHAKGGNVVDVAVAVALSLAVTHPYYASLGGGGFALVKVGAKDIRALDFREMAPAQAEVNLYKDKPKNASVDGGLAVGVPGVPAGLWELHKAYGKLKWSQLFDGAIRLAEKGFRVSGEWVDNTTDSKERFNKDGAKILMDAQGKMLKPGDLLKQPGLARLLKSLSQKGPKAFYEGDVANDIVATVKNGGGIVTPADLKAYRTRWLEPITADYLGHKLYLMPPPSSGGVVIAQAVKLIEKLGVQKLEPFSVDELHMLAEIMKYSYRGRALLGDPDFNKNPVPQLLADDYLSKGAAMIRKDKAMDVEPLKELAFEKPSTTHFSVMDSAGDAVSFTVTINGNYGSGLITPKYGIALNNEMDDFTTKPGEPNMFGLIQGEANSVRAGSRPLSSMSPTIIEKNGRTVLALGAPGGPRIISAVFQVLHRTLAQGFDVDRAIQSPRVHHQFLPNKVFTDKRRLPPETLAALRIRGHVVEEASSMGKGYAVYLSEDGILSGAADARGEAGAGGY